MNYKGKIKKITSEGFGQPAEALPFLASLWLTLTTPLYFSPHSFFAPSSFANQKKQHLSFFLSPEHTKKKPTLQPLISVCPLFLIHSRANQVVSFLLYLSTTSLKETMLTFYPLFITKTGNLNSIFLPSFPGLLFNLIALSFS